MSFSTFDNNLIILETGLIQILEQIVLSFDYIEKLTKSFHDLTNYHNKSLLQHCLQSLKMSPVAIILKEEANPDLRTIAYETYKKENFVIVKQELRDNDWITINHMALPIVIFDYIQSFRFEKALMKRAQYTIEHVTGYKREFVFNPETIDENVRKILYDYDIKEIPLYENQEGYWRDLEIIDSFWRIPKSPESPDITTRSNSPLPDSTPAPSTPKVAEVSIISSSSLETPTVSLCFAPKKRKLDINF